MSSTAKCFWLEPVPGRDRAWYRRFMFSRPGLPCAHKAMVLIAADAQARASSTPTDAERADPRWPTTCEACGAPIPAEAEWQVFASSLYRRADTGELLTLREAPPGAMWDATWFHDQPNWCGPDGRCIVVVTPDGHQWMIDSRASNCDKPHDTKHKCWVRHGEPPVLTVDKAGHTCGAGAGSIQTPKWHGFLRNGVLAP